MAALFTAAKISVLLALPKIIDLFINYIHPTSLPRIGSSRNSPRSLCVEGTRNEALRTSAWEASIRQVHRIHTSPYYFLLHVSSVETLFFFLNLATNSVPLTSEVPPSSPKIGNKSEVFLNVTVCQRCQWRGWIFYSSSDVFCARACRLSLIISSVGS